MEEFQVPKNYNGDECFECAWGYKDNKSPETILADHDACHGWYHCGNECCGPCYHCNDSKASWGYENQAPVV